PLVGGRLVALTGEDVPEVPVAGSTQHLSTDLSQRTVLAYDHRVRVGRVVERRPTAVAVELRRAAEQLRPTATTRVHALGERVVVLTGERPFGGRLAQYRVLPLVELFAPLLFGLRHARGGGRGLVTRRHTCHLTHVGTDPGR